MPDPDDTLCPDAIESLLLHAADNVDMVSSSYIMYRNDRLVSPSKVSYDKVFSVQDYIETMGIIPQPRNLDRRLCNKLFRASIIKDNNLYLCEDLFYREDILFNYQYLEYCRNQIVSISKDTYCYYRRTSGAAISLQTRYTQKSGGKFIAMARCMDILNRIDASLVVKNRMRKEIISTFSDVISLIDKTKGCFLRDRLFYYDILKKYFSKKELFILDAKRVYKRIHKLFSFR